jgi:O-antigen/teichoic acid export membrane protein
VSPAAPLGDEPGTISIGSTSFGSIAAKGSLVNTFQWLVNKVATAAAMLVIAHYLTPADYGVANQAIAITAFMVLFLPLTMGDVLIAHPYELESLAPTAGRLALLIGIITGLLMVASIPIYLHVYRDYPAAWLGGLVLVMAARPVLDAALVVPLARMRTGLQYRRIATIDGVVQLGATVASLLMAMAGLRGASLVAPQVAGTAVRALWYRRIAQSTNHGTYRSSSARVLMRAYLPAASAQYLHNVIVMLEILVLGYVAGERQTGLFAFAFQVAAQANTVVAYQLGSILQPILGHLREDPQRQVRGFLRAQRMLGLICVPISMTQAVLAEPLFRIAFPSDYAPAIPIFQVISLAQAFYFATGPSMSCLRSQRRFTTFLAWQAAQCALSLPLYWIAASLWKDHGALGVALASATGWAVSSPVVVWLCTRVAPRRQLMDVIAVFLKPWMLATPIFVVAWLVVQELADFGRVGDVLSLVVVGPGAVLASLVAAHWFDEDMRALIDKVFSALRARLRRRTS